MEWLVVGTKWSRFCGEIELLCTAAVASVDAVFVTVVTAS